MVYDHNGVVVKSFPAVHIYDGPVSYRLEWNGLTFVFSGDTTPSQFFVDNAKSADLLIHEVAVIDPELSKSYPSYRAIEDHHTLPEDAGKIFASAKPKLAVYSHIVFATLKQVQDVPEDALIARTRTTYDGPLIVGRDLMSFTISDKVEAFAPDGEPVKPVMAGQ